ncbi:MAG: NADH-quinone oxidoreductase subunit N [Deltaproteobacteria bacterium]|nr:MAG: NADH-quinone oxidoreductase subunit N [Deltaproteobacteria bacterium]
MVTANDLLAVLPFLIAAAGGLAIILMDALSPPEVSRRFLGGFSLVFLGAMAASAAVTLGAARYPAFGTMVVADDFGRFFTILFASAAAIAVLVAMGRLPDRADGKAARGEFYALLLISCGGASLLAQATDLVSLFIAIETLSIPAYVLAALLRSDGRSAEAGLKYFVLGAFATGLLVYGIALLYGAAGSTEMSAVAKAAMAKPWTQNYLLAAGALLVLAGLIFKISIVPLHMWAPDVYQGAPTASTAFFATGVKAAAFAALLRVLTLPLAQLRMGGEGLEPAGWYVLLQGFAIATMTVANLTALVQRDVKRLLAYSSVAHAGYLLVGTLCGRAGAAAMAYYLLAYTFMTGGAFALVAWLERNGAGTSLEEYRGAGRRNPVAAVLLSVFLFSLAGIPPTAGFFGKFYLFKAAVDEGLVVLVVIAVLNSMVSAYYYLRVMVAMYMEPEGEPSAPVAPAAPIVVAAAFCLVFTIALGILPSPVLRLATASVAGLF